ncbi:hypothetical protein GMORB2_6714 [Geosmithia morbida]|uniref:DNA-directed RNA polymerase I subunit rpa49 n=1 Tax=Geosmithia morbida TaxID=1094350 RepID=A0A9P5D453_9HYPO|nr:uncharacterized protein GMORB2_6714 [Geosmithia morbida]KAF4123166.1 hypothetical protein GMORB2_6714 [Geosmithia morbida]
MAKRKRDGEPSAKAPKKAALVAPASVSKVSSLLQPKSSPPVIGIQIPSSIKFQSYASPEAAQPRSKSSRKASQQQQQQQQRELLLHSTEHPNLDYIAREEVGRGSEQLVKHYVAVTMMDRKTELGQIFGTKKAKKAIEANVLNAISPQKRRGEGGEEEEPAKMDAASRAMLSSIGAVTSSMASREELQAAVDEAKPAPRPNLEATEVEDVYDPRAMIGADVLNLVPVREWQEKVQHREGVQVVSRFVANRVNRVAAAAVAAAAGGGSGDEADVVRLRVLRYFYLVLLMYLNTKPGRERGTRQLPPREKLHRLLEPAPEAVVENIRRKFSDGGVMRKFHVDTLMTHCCAFACIVDNYEVDTQNLRDDLRVDQKTINQYFHEIGGRVKPVSNKAEGRTVHVAKLALPLDFPKQRHLAPKRR